MQKVVNPLVLVVIFLVSSIHLGKKKENCGIVYGLVAQHHVFLVGTDAIGLHSIVLKHAKNAKNEFYDILANLKYFADMSKLTWKKLNIFLSYLLMLLLCWNLICLKDLHCGKTSDIDFAH